MLFLGGSLSYGFNFIATNLMKYRTGETETNSFYGAIISTTWFLYHSWEKMFSHAWLKDTLTFKTKKSKLLNVRLSAVWWSVQGMTIHWDLIVHMLDGSLESKFVRRFHLNTFVGRDTLVEFSCLQRMTSWIQQEAVSLSVFSEPPLFGSGPITALTYFCNSSLIFLPV